MRIAAIGDIHCRIYSHDLVEKLLPGIHQEADVLIVSGDLTDTGLVEEAEVLADQFRRLTLPVIAVLGNHDHESGKEAEIKSIMIRAGVIILDATAYEIGDIGFAGTKGFCGGFGKNMIQPFGEKAMKRFIETAIDEAVELENVLARLECEHKVAILHYAPIKETLEGESPEIYAFLGSDRLGEVLDRREVSVAIHGHAHHGSPAGHTAGGVPVYNVSRYVQTHYFQRPYYVFELGQEMKEVIQDVKPPAARAAS